MKQPKILIADDEQKSVIPLTAILEGEGYEVESAADGQKALEKLAGGDYAAVLADFMMPKLDGMALLKELRSKRPHDVPFREDADQILTVDYEGGADVLEAHHLGRLGDGRRGRDRDEIDAHELADGRHDRS